MNYMSIIPALLLVGAVLTAGPKPDQLPTNILVKRDRALYLTGTIGAPSQVMFMSQLRHLVTIETKEPAYVLVSSLGGDIEYVKQMQTGIEVLKSKGVFVTCIVVDNAQSAALSFLTSCNKRVALATARFMMHQVRAVMPGIGVSSQELKQLAGEVDQLNESTVAELIASMKPPLHKKFREEFFRTKEWTGEQLAKEYPGWVGLVDTIEYVD